MTMVISRAVLCAGLSLFLIALDMQLPTLEVSVCPTDKLGLADTHPAVCQELHEVRAVFGLSCSSGTYFLDEP